MYILGIHNGHDASACIFKDHELIAFCKEERLTRRKNDGSRFDLAAIDEVLRIAGIRSQQIDTVTMSRKKLPLQAFKKVAVSKKIRDFTRNFNQRAKGLSLEKEMIRHRQIDETKLLDIPALRLALKLHDDAEIRFVNHDYAHILSAFYTTTWQKNALYLSCDGGGDGSQYSAYYYDGEKLECLIGGDECLFERPQNLAASIGQAYGITTKILGYRKNRHEGKLTGLAAFGQPIAAPTLLTQYAIDDQGNISSKLPDLKSLVTYLQKLFDGMKKEDVAASIQQVTELLVCQWIKTLLKNRSVKYIGLAGGVFSNVLLNQKIGDLPGIDEVMIFPAMTDEGLVVGNCVEKLIQQHGVTHVQRRIMQNLYFGHPYTGQNLLDSGKASGFRLIETEQPAVEAAKLLSQGAIGAIFYQGMEMGPRALGARSIVAAPSHSALNDSLNKRLERTEFMPFAPYVLDQDAAEVFELSEKNLRACRYMTITTRVKERHKDKIPAVVHVDGTARPQIAYREDNPLYYDVLKEFKSITGIPCLVNTSFNAHEEPIINKPAEAVIALKDNRVDFLICEAGLVLSHKLALSTELDSI